MMSVHNRLLQHSLILLQLLLFVAQGIAQSGMNIAVGESHLFDLKTEPGITYCWRVLDNISQSKRWETDKVTFLSAKCGPSISLRWEKSGIFFLEVTGVNPNGCTNIKIFQINVQGLHIPIANNDYASTDWLKSVVINILNNDHDTGNDIEISSLKILTKSEYGEVIANPNGSITYTPLQKQAGTVFFQYKICDACNQCDTAKISIEVHDPPLFLPQGISPNGDGMNDKFVVKGLDAYPGSSITIFCRDGVIVYKSDNYQNDWGGVDSRRNQEGTRLPSGTYYYLLLPGGTNRIIKGFIYLAE